MLARRGSSDSGSRSSGFFFPVFFPASGGAVFVDCLVAAFVAVFFGVLSGVFAGFFTGALGAAAFAGGFVGALGAAGFAAVDAPFSVFFAVLGSALPAFDGGFVFFVGGFVGLVAISLPNFTGHTFCLTFAADCSVKGVEAV